MANRKKRSDEKDRRFLAALSEGHSIAKSAEMAGYSHRSVYEYRDQDEEFAQAWEAAYERGTDNLEDAMFQKAMRMDDGPSVTAGIFMLKGRRPEKYAERQISENVNKNYNISDEPMTDEDWEAEYGQTAPSSHATH